jgi:hypothetical protein
MNTIAYVTPIIASIGPTLMDQLLTAGLQTLIDPASWFFIWMWIMLLMSMLFKFLS